LSPPRAPRTALSSPAADILLTSFCTVGAGRPVSAASCWAESSGRSARMAAAMARGRAHHDNGIVCHARQSHRTCSQPEPRERSNQTESFRLSRRSAFAHGRALAQIRKPFSDAGQKDWPTGRAGKAWHSPCHVRSGCRWFPLSP
jgi:hypothetical protein